MDYRPQCRVALSVVFDGFGGDDSAPLELVVTPRRCRVVKNNYKEADTFDLSFDGLQLPISPEMIRGAGVQIYIYDTPVLGAPPPVAPPMQLAGLIDNAKLIANGDGFEFSCSGRDYTGLLLDRQWDPAKRVAVGRTLVETVQELSDEVTQGVGTGKRLTVRYVGEGASPIVGSYHNVKSKKRGFSTSRDKSYWDVIYNLCIRHACIVFVDGFEIIISFPDTLIEKAKGSLVRVAYGRNLTSLEIERKLGKETVPQIVCRGYDPKTQELLVAKYPEKGQKPAKGIGTKRDESKAFTPPGITDLAGLKAAAKTIYHSIARGEGKIRISSRHLTDLSGKDMLALKAGVPLSVAFEPYVTDAVFSRLSNSERITRLRKYGYGAEVAKVIASEFDRIDYFRRPFYTTEATIEFEEKEGVTVEAEAQNFISEDRELRTAGETIVSGFVGGAARGS